MVLAGQTWDSRGSQIARIDDMIRYFNDSNVPVSMDDGWGENRASRPRKNFQPDDIRRALWKCIAAGGLGGLIRGSVYWFSIDGGNGDGPIANDLESEQWLRFVNPFLETKLGDTFGEMVPAPELVANGYALADPPDRLFGEGRRLPAHGVATQDHLGGAIDDLHQVRGAP